MSGRNSKLKLVTAADAPIAREIAVLAKCHELLETSALENNTLKLLFNQGGGDDVEERGIDLLGIEL